MKIAITAVVIILIVVGAVIGIHTEYIPWFGSSQESRAAAEAEKGFVNPSPQDALEYNASTKNQISVYSVDASLKLLPQKVEIDALMLVEVAKTGKTLVVIHGKDLFEPSLVYVKSLCQYHQIPYECHYKDGSIEKMEWPKAISEKPETPSKTEPEKKEQV